MERYLNCDGAYGKYIMQELKLPAAHAAPEAVQAYEALGKKRIHWIDGQNMLGCVQLNTSWYFEANREKLTGENAPTDTYSRWAPHVHDVDEILCFYGSDPYDMYNLNGEIEILIGGETHILTKSSLIYIPAGVPHTPPLVNRVDKPIFHFSMVLSPEYNFKTEGNEEFRAV